MAKTSSSAQHYLECDNCEENPAQYFCKMCAGHLCETCKSDHGKRKITRNHEIVSMTSNNENLVECIVPLIQIRNWNVTATFVKNQYAQIALFDLIMDIL